MLTTLVVATTPFAPLPDELVQSAEVQTLLAGGDVVVARPGSKNQRRAFTGLALIEQPCTVFYRLISEPANYPDIYPMVEKIKVRSRQPSSITFEMFISAGAGSSKKVMTMRLLPNRVLDTTQEAGHSTWHFIEVTSGSCLLQFTHDEDFTHESMVLRMALAKKTAIVQGIQAAAAVGNVRNIRASRKISPKPITVDEQLINRVLARLAHQGTAAFIAHKRGSRARVAARTGSERKALQLAKNSSRWKDFMPLFSGQEQQEQQDQPVLGPRETKRRYMRYQIDSLFEEVEFQTEQSSGDDFVTEVITGGELTSGGWTFRSYRDSRGGALLLDMQLDITQGDWLVGKITEIDRTAQEGTLLGVAFMVVEKVALQSRQ